MIFKNKFVWKGLLNAANLESTGQFVCCKCDQIKEPQLGHMFVAVVTIKDRTILQYSVNEQQSLRTHMHDDKSAQYNIILESKRWLVT